MFIEYASGGNLYEFMLNSEGKVKPMSEEQIQIVLSQIFSAMIYCHNHSIIHRDLKPLNILLTSPGDLKGLKVSEAPFYF